MHLCLQLPLELLVHLQARAKPSHACVDGTLVVGAEVGDMGQQATRQTQHAGPRTDLC